MTSLPAQGADDDELMRLLGRVVVNWSHLEMMVGDLFAHLCGGHQGAMVVVTSNVSQHSLCGWIRTLLALQAEPETWMLQAAEALDAIDQLRPERNTIVHGWWMPSGIPGSAIVRTARLERREVLVSEVTTEADLQHLIERLLEAKMLLAGALALAGIEIYANLGHGDRLEK